MARRSTKEGVCRICFEKTTLNYEHVPPQSSFNKHTRFKIGDFTDYITSSNPLQHNVKGPVMQGGLGFHSFCSSCNSMLGNNYVRAYKEWAKIGAHILSQGDFKGYKYDVYKQPPLKILKQVISMFLAINDENFSIEHKELASFVLDPKKTQLSDRYRVRMYLNEGPQMRVIQRSFVTDFSARSAIHLSEFAFPPYGYVLTIDHPDDIDYLADITHFKNLNKKEGHTLNLTLAKLPTVLPIALDYRSAGEVDQDIRNDS